MNNELIKMVSERVGLSEDKARAATEAVLGYVKNKVPQPIASQIDNVVGGGSGSSGGLGPAAEKLGETFRK